MISEGLDHVVIGVPDLATGLEWFEREAGVAPEPGGRHEDLGTHNALVSLGDREYLEILAADPERDVANKATTWLRSLTRPAPFGWAVRCRRAAETVERLRSSGVQATDVPYTRTTDDGSELGWDVVLLDSPFEQTVPFLIDWRDVPSPASTAPTGCRLLDLTPLSPDPQGAQRFIDAIGFETQVEAAPGNGLRLSIGTPRGVLEVSS